MSDVARRVSEMVALNRAVEAARLKRYRRLMAARQEVEDMFGSKVDVMTDIDGRISFARRTPVPYQPRLRSSRFS